MFKRYDHFHLDPDFFPESTRKAFSTSIIIKNGALPIGFKSEFSFFARKRVLNVGLLNPEATDGVLLENEARRNLGADAFQRLQVFKIAPEEFVQILERFYGVKRSSLGLIEEAETHPTLRHFISTEKDFL